MSPNVGPTDQQDAEDLALVLREARERQGVSAAELARRTGVTPSDVLDFEAARVVPARPPFALYMRALGFSA
ncbi:helix-turn-helix domain-containing protein [Pseudonocardia sp. TRM90224]|uniref:helix-turn-helix domain-containing protein n=1 Tax=Pseudonocardia sp. TRM90224 TaxID=2812678 RepID=UPI001E5E2CF3|nr:helix-turn-helix transcriptional regulator [Pseudonocardia sp. TRM90224]